MNSKASFEGTKFNAMGYQNGKDGMLKYMKDQGANPTSVLNFEITVGNTTTSTTINCRNGRPQKCDLIKMNETLKLEATKNATTSRMKKILAERQAAKAAKAAAKK
jgi:hypothetical protein